MLCVPVISYTLDLRCESVTYKFLRGKILMNCLQFVKIFQHQ